MAAKQISQQTFDDAVRENMTEFEMCAEEAVQVAVDQFESMSVNLSIIVKDPALYSDEGGDSLHPVVDAVQRLSKSLEDNKDEQIMENLTLLQKECDIDLARRCLAGSNNGYPVVYKALAVKKDCARDLSVALCSLCSLTRGQPDLIDDAGRELLIDLLQKYKDNPEIIEMTVKAIRYNCVKHEQNRQGFVGLKLITLLTELLVECKANPSIVKEVCMTLRALTQDDDVRVPFGKAHDNAKMIVTEGDVLKAILDLCEEYKNNTGVLGELFLTLSCVAVRNEFCQEVMDRGGVSFIINAFQNSLGDKLVVRHALIVLKSLAGNDEVKAEVARLGGIPLVVAAMMKHQTNASIADGGCRVLTAVTLRNQENCSKVIECHGHQNIVQAMKLHPSDANVQKQACMALRNLVSRTKDFTDGILELGTEDLLNTAMNTHKDVHDEAKAALRDLGCKVALKELWTGQRGTIA